MNRLSCTTMLAVLALAVASVAAAGHGLGSCVIYGVDRVPDLEGETLKVVDNSTKTCSQCKWQCLTYGGLCPYIFFNGVQVSLEEQAGLIESNADCGDGYFAGRGLCLLLSIVEETPEEVSATILDTQEQGCRECAQQCTTWGPCDAFIYNGTWVENAVAFETCAELGGLTPQANPPINLLPDVRV